MRVILLLILILFSSCRRRGNQEVELTKKISLDETLCQAEVSEQFRIGDYPENKWWEEFEDDHLSCLIQTALNENPSLLAAKKRVDVANQTALMVRSKLFPEVSGMFQYAWLYLVDSHFLQALLPGLQNSNFLYNLMFNFDYEFDFWGKNRKKYKAALGSARATSLSYEEAKLILSVSIAKSYVNLVSLKAKKEVLEQILCKKEKFLSLIELRKKNRLDTKIDSNTYSQKIKNLEEGLTVINQEILLEKSLINILVGRNPQHEVDTIAIYKAFEKKPELPEDITSTLLLHRPDLLSALWVAKKNALEIGVSITEFLPDVTILDGPAFAAGRAEEFFSSKSFANLILPEVKQPIFTGGRLMANWRKSVAAYKASVYEFNDLFLQAAKQVHDAVIKYMESEEIENLQEEKLVVSKKNYELEFLRFSHGIASMLSLLEYDESYLQNKTFMIEKQRRKKLAYISFIQSIGGGFVEEKNGTKK